MHKKSERQAHLKSARAFQNWMIFPTVKKCHSLPAEKNAFQMESVYT